MRPGLVTDLGVDAHGRSTAVFSPDREHRYALTRHWGDGPTTCFLMLNPSTADAFVLDPTVRRCVNFARDWGSGSLLVLNAFALRSTKPKHLYGHPDPTGADNDAVIDEALRRYQPAQVVAAWGAHAGRLDGRGKQRSSVNIADRARWRSREHDLSDRLGDRLLALHVTKDGHPGHPLYLPADLRPQPWTRR